MQYKSTVNLFTLHAVHNGSLIAKRKLAGVREVFYHCKMSLHTSLHLAVNLHAVSYAHFFFSDWIQLNTVPHFHLTDSLIAKNLLLSKSPKCSLVS